MIAESADLARLVRSPVFTSAEIRARHCRPFSTSAGIGGTSAKFLKLLTANRRLFVVRDVIRTFRALVARFKGEATAEVTVAEPLSDKNLDALKGALKSVTGKDVDLKVKVDPADHRRAGRQGRQPHGRFLAPHQTQFDQARDERGRLMDIRAAEISAILKDQIKNFGAGSRSQRSRPGAERR